MAYQAPSIWYRDQKGLGSEDWKTGIETQDKTETLRRKNALADAFSKSIVTEIQKDADGNIVARPGDVDQQAFFKHSAASGLGFDEAKAVYDHYDMQKKASLNALKMGSEIEALGGGSNVPSRAGAPIITDTTNPQIPVPTPSIESTTPKAPELISSPLTKELDGKTDYEKVSKLQEWMNSKKADKIRAAQAIVGAKIDGEMGNNTRTAFSDWKDRVIKSNLSKDDTTGAQNRIDIIAGSPSKGDEGKLSVGDAFDSQPPKPGTLPREDTRTYLQVIEDRGAQNKFGRGDKKEFGFEVPKLSDFGNYKTQVSLVLSKAGLPNSDEGIKKYVDKAVSNVGDYVYDPAKSPFENRQAEIKNNAEKNKAANEAIKGLSQGVDIVKGQTLASRKDTRDTEQHEADIGSRRKNVGTTEFINLRTLSTEEKNATDKMKDAYLDFKAASKIGGYEGAYQKALAKAKSDGNVNKDIVVAILAAMGAIPSAKAQTIKALMNENGTISGDIHKLFTTALGNAVYSRSKSEDEWTKNAEKNIIETMKSRGVGVLSGAQKELSKGLKGKKISESRAERMKRLGL